MNTPRKLSFLLAIAGLLSAAHASAQTTFTWSLGSADGTAVTGDFNNAANWTPQTVPTGATATAIIDNVTGLPHNQTVTYDIGTTRTLGTLNLLNSAGAGFIDLLQLTSTVAGSATTRLTLTNALVLGSSAGTVEIRLSPSTTAAASAALSDAAGLTINAGGIVTLDSSALASTVPAIFANTTISGGTLSVLGNSTATTIGTTSANNTLTVGNGGQITFNATGVNSTGRLQINGNFTTTAGSSITASAGANVIELYGTTNSITGTTYTSPGTLTYSLRANAAESLTSTVDLPNLLLRNGQTDTVNVGTTNVGAITINAASNTVLKLGSNLTTASVPTFGATLTSATAISGLGVDLNGLSLTSTATTGTLGVAAFNTFAITSSQGNGVLSVPGFNLGTATTAVINIGANVTLTATASATSGTVVDTVGAATVNPSSTIAITGNSNLTNRIGLVALSAGSTIGNLQVGNGTTSTTYVQLQTGAFAIQGNASVLSGSTLDLNTRTHTVAGKLQGNGTITGAANAGVPAMLTFTANGGLSPGFGTGNTGSGFVGTLTLVGTQTMNFASTSASIFDLASNTSFDTLAAGTGSTVIVNLNGTLTVNLLNGYTPMQGQTWTILTGLNAASSGTFSNISDGIAGDVYSFLISGGTGTLTLVSVPEPSTWAMVGMLLVAFPVYRASRRRSARA